jgi:adenylate cyclase class 2
MSDYVEHEVKFLDVNIEQISKKLAELGAAKVFDEDRIVTTFRTNNPEFLASKASMKLTEEGKLKLSVSHNNSQGEKETIKLFVSRKKEALDLLKVLGYSPDTESTSRRISFEWEGIDFDIDQFPDIPPFMEVDLGESTRSLEEIIALLGLENNVMVDTSTPGIYQRYSIDYAEKFKL